MIDTGIADDREFEFQVVSFDGEPFYTKPGSEKIKEKIGLADKIEAAHGSGLYFYYDPSAGELLCYFQGVRNVSQQMYILYKSDPSSDFFKEFKQRFYHELKNEDIDVLNDIDGPHEVFEQIDSGTHAPPDELVSDLDVVIGDSESPDPHRIGSPDYETAIGIANWLLDENPDSKIAIGGELWVEDVLDPDFLFLIRNGDSPALRDDSRSYIQSKELENHITATRENIATTLSNLSSDAQVRNFAHQLNDSGLEDLGFNVFDQNELSKTLASVRDKSAIYTYVVGIVALLVAGTTQGWTGELFSLLLSDYRIILPGWLGLSSVIEESTLNIPSWIVFQITILILCVNLYGRISQRDISFFTLGGDTSVKKAGNSTKSKCKDIVDDIKQIESHNRIDTGQFGTFESILQNKLFGESDLQAYSDEDYASYRREKLLKGLFIGLVAVLGTAILFASLFQLFTRFWNEAVSAILIIGIVGAFRIVSPVLIAVSTKITSKVDSSPSANIVDYALLSVFILSGVQIVPSLVHSWNSSAVLLFSFVENISAQVELEASDIYYGCISTTIGFLISLASMEALSSDRRYAFVTGGLVASAVLTGLLGSLPLSWVLITLASALGLGMVFWTLINAYTRSETRTGLIWSVLLVTGVGTAGLNIASHAVFTIKTGSPVWTVLDGASLVFILSGFYLLKKSGDDRVFILGPAIPETYLPEIGLILSSDIDTTANDALSELADVSEYENVDIQDFLDQHGYDTEYPLVPLHAEINGPNGATMSVSATLRKKAYLMKISYVR